MKKNKITIIGHFGGTKTFTDGQTIKTKILYTELNKNTNWKINKVDTYYNQSNKVKLLFQTIVYTIFTKNIIVLLSINGMKVYFPFLYILKKVFKKNIYHDVIGGNLDEYVEKYPNFRRYLKSFNINWVETQKLKKNLLKLDINNCEVLPNFKSLKIKRINNNLKKEIKFCTFSRVMKEKGITDAINTINSIINKNTNIKIYLDIYGPIDIKYREEFEKLLQDSDSNIKYCNSIDYDKSVEVLVNYDALLFPTHWDGEGFPGTVIDAFCAGLPVIATDWSSNNEIIKDKETGILYPSSNYCNLEEAVQYFIDNKAKLQSMKRKCNSEAEKYKPEKNIKIVINKINN